MTTSSTGARFAGRVEAEMASRRPLGASTRWNSDSLIGRLSSVTKGFREVPVISSSRRRSTTDDPVHRHLSRSRIARGGKVARTNPRLRLESSDLALVHPASSLLSRGALGDRRPLAACSVDGRAAQENGRRCAFTRNGTRASRCGEARPAILTLRSGCTFDGRRLSAGVAWQPRRRYGQTGRNRRCGKRSCHSARVRLR